MSNSIFRNPFNTQFRALRKWMRRPVVKQVGFLAACICLPYVYSCKMEGRPILPMAIAPAIATESDAIALEGSLWVVPDTDGAVHFRLDAATGMAMGSNGCDRFSTSYEWDGNGRITFGRSIYTLSVCPNQSDAEALNRALRGRRTLVQEGRSLTFIDARGKQLARFVAEDRP